MLDKKRRTIKKDSKGDNMKQRLIFLALFCVVLTTLAGVVVTVGTGTGYNGPYSPPSPYSNADQVEHEQYLILASELTSAGGGYGAISSIAFNVHSVNGCDALNRYRIKLAHTTLTGLTDYVETGLTEVFYSNPYQPVAGWNIHNFSAPYVWDGVSNLLVDISYRIMNTTTANASVYHTDTSPDIRCLYLLSGSSAQSYVRPNIRLEMSDGYIQVGEGTESRPVPVSTGDSYGYSQTIYWQSEIEVPGQQITRIAYQWDGAAACPNAADWTIYMGHTTQTYFANNGDWVPLAQLTQVFSGNVALAAVPGWVEIILDTPFTYNNVDNLVIAVDENTPGSDFPTGDFYCTLTSVMQKRSIHFYHYEINPDPANPPTSVGNYLAYPNVRLKFQAPVVGPPLPPVPVYPEDSATGLPRAGFSISWAPDAGGGLPDSYTLYLASSPGVIYDQYSFSNLTANSFNPVTQGGMNFEYLQTWYWAVRAVNTSGNTVFSPPRSFQIEADPALVIPHLESFDSSELPPGWTQTYSATMTGEIWWPSNSNYAGGTPYEMQAADVDETGVTRFISNAIITTGIPAFLVSFKHYFEDYDAGLTAKLQYSHDLSTWYDSSWIFTSGSGDVFGEASVLLYGLGAPYTYVAWVLEGDHYMMNGWYLDDIEFSLPYAHDVAVVSIGNVPEVATTDAVFASARIANYGTTTQSFNVLLQTGTRFTDTQPVANLAPGAFVDVYFNPFLPIVNQVNQIVVTTLLAGDQNSSNDQLSQDFLCLNLDTTALVYVDYSLTAQQDGAATFTLSRPSLITPILAGPLSVPYINGADWINGTWYALEKDWGH